MMDRKLIIFLVMGMLGAVAPRPALSQFDESSAGGRAAGMGRARTALPGDAFGMQVNPAGLAAITGRQAAFDYDRMFIGLSDHSRIDTTYMGYAQQLGSYGTAGLSLMRFQLEGYYREDTLALSLGRRIYWRRVFGDRPLSVGASIKMLTKGYAQTRYTSDAVNLNTGQRLGGADPVFGSGYARSAPALDAGVQCALSARSRLGLAFNNLNQPNLGLSEADLVPASMRAGYSYEGEQVTVAADLLVVRSDTRLFAGIERSFFKQLFVRGGAGVGSREYASVSCGAGWRYARSAQIDYSFEFPLQGIKGTSGSQKISLLVFFGASSAQQRTPAKYVVVVSSRAQGPDMTVGTQPGFIGPAEKTPAVIQVIAPVPSAAAAAEIQPSTVVPLDRIPDVIQIIYPVVTPAEPRAVTPDRVPQSVPAAEPEPPVEPQPETSAPETLTLDAVQRVLPASGAQIPGYTRSGSGDPDVLMPETKK